jgi:peptidoglycan hydrolase CwlO-like protein
MRVRHRIPSIFNLSMVDVLCCALGCVILLWLINLREAKQYEDTAEEENRQIAQRLSRLQTEREETLGKLSLLQSQVESLREEKSDLQKQLDKSVGRITSLTKELNERSKRLEMESEHVDELKLKQKAAAARVADLERQLSTSEKRGETATARVRELSEALNSAKNRLKDVQEASKVVPVLRADLKEARELYATEKALASALEKEIAKRLREMTDVEKKLESLQTAKTSLQGELARRENDVQTLRRENQKLQGESARIRSEADNRFAGIALTGRRVLFLVDASGSMELVDENTRAPTKWADVRNTVARLMRSMPELQKYQVIVFSEKSSFLFEGEDDWLDFNVVTSPQRVVDALAKIGPKGGTNLYDALKMAFRLRDKGMDTIYLLSDGLPNLGEGVAADTVNTLREVERTDRLARYLRKTLQTDWNRPRAGQSRVRINTIGFFYESPDVGAFLWALARENDGSFVGMSKP